MRERATGTFSRSALTASLAVVCACATSAGMLGSTQPAAASARPTVPGAPMRVAAGPEPAGAFVNWTTPSSDGGAPITRYKILATDLSDPARGGQKAATKGSVGQIVRGLTAGDRYTFTVSAGNSVGTGPTSTPSNTVVPALSAPPRGISCEHVTGTTSGIVTLSSCHAVGGALAGKGTMSGVTLKGTRKGTISWRVGNEMSSTTIAVKTTLAPNPTKGWCPSRGFGQPYDVTGKVIADSEPDIAVGQAVTGYICVSSAGAVKQNHYGSLSL